MPTARGLAPDLLESMVHNIVYQTYDEIEQLYPQLFNIENTSDAFVDDFSFAGLGRFRLKPEGVSVTFDDPVQGDRRRTIMLTFALGNRVTMEMREDSKHGLIQDLSADLGRAANDSEERLAWGMYDDLWTGATYTGIPEGDGVRRAMFSTTHVRLKDQATYSNRLFPGVALSQSGIESVVTMMRKTTSDEGRQVNVKERMLVIHTDDLFEAEVLLESVGRPGSADNDLNTLRRLGLKVLGQPYSTDVDAWSVWPDKHSLTYWRRKPFTMTTAMDSQTFDQMNIAHYRSNVSFGEPRGPIGVAP